MAKSLDDKISDVLAPLSNRHKRIVMALFAYRESWGESSPISEDDIIMLTRDMRAILVHYEELVRTELTTGSQKGM